MCINRVVDVIHLHMRGFHSISGLKTSNNLLHPTSLGLFPNVRVGADWRLGGAALANLRVPTGVPTPDMVLGDILSRCRRWRVQLRLQ